MNGIEHLYNIGFERFFGDRIQIAVTTTFQKIQVQHLLVFQLLLLAPSHNQ
ncbi:hypothetical protein QFZ80_007535 [Paenibacillus sp. V4I7]|nr:hypothetical protein [Paenibacillus sp. V4I7]